MAALPSPSARFPRFVPQPTTTLTIPLDISPLDPGRVQGTATDFREGTLMLSPEGLTIDGKELLPRSRRLLLMALVALTGVGALLCYFIVQYIRTARLAQYSWSEVEQIVVEPSTYRLAFVVVEGQPAKRSTVVTRVHPALLQHVVTAIQLQLGAHRVVVGPIAPSLPRWVPAVVIGSMLFGTLVTLVVILVRG